MNMGHAFFNEMLTFSVHIAATGAIDAGLMHI